MTRRTRQKQKKMQEVGASKQLEVRYRNEMDALLKYMLDIALNELREPETINDALPDYLKSLSAKANRIFDMLDKIDLGAIANAMASRIVNTANNVNRQRFDKKAGQMFGIDLKGALASSGKAVQDELDLARYRNADLIKSVATEFKKEISDTIMQNVYEGQRSTNLITQIKERYHVTESRAKLIARNETSRINGDLVRIRAQALGSKTYVWSGVMDERNFKRTDHYVMNGMLCKWDDKTVFSDDNGVTWKKRKSIGGVEAHPSEQINCRCAALAQVEF